MFFFWSKLANADSSNSHLYAKEIKRRSPRRGYKWHMDEMCIVMNGIKFWLWMAVDQEGYELDILLQSRRDKKVKSPKQVQQFLSRHGLMRN